VNFITNHSCISFVAGMSRGIPLPDAFEVLGRPRISGKIAVIPSSMRPRGVIVVDWTTERSVMLQVTAVSSRFVFKQNGPSSHQKNP
jgi:hypothetical protein